MSGPLSVLTEAQDWLYRTSESRGDDDRAEAVKHAIATLAELADTAHEFARGMPLSLADNTAVIGAVNAQALERLRALARAAKGLQP